MTSGDICGCYSLSGVIGIWWVEARAAAQPPAVHRPGLSSAPAQSKNYLAENVGVRLVRNPGKVFSEACPHWVCFFGVTLAQGLDVLVFPLIMCCAIKTLVTQQS